MHRLFLIVGILCVSTITRASTVTTETVVCPLDSTKIGYEVMMSWTLMGQRLDLMPIGAVTAPASLAVCPKDGLVVLARGYEDEQVEILRALVASRPYLAAKDKGPDFQLGMIQEALGENSTAALSYLRASWRATGEIRTAVLTESLRAYTALLAGGGGDPERTWSNDVLAGEIERQLGRFDAARARFERLQTDPRAKSPPFNIIVPYELQLISDKDSAPHLIPQALP